MQKLTAIVATIGPASSSEEIIKQLILAGMNVARFNTKHGEVAWHREKIKLVHEVAHKLNKPIAILLDLQGPEVRIDLPDGKSFSVKTDEEVTFTSNRSKNGERIIYVPEKVISILKSESLVLLDDGACEFKVTAQTFTDLTARALGDCEVKHRKTLNTPGLVVDMPSLIETDFTHLDHVAELKIDYVGLSYVRDKNDIDFLRQELAKRQVKANIIAKIENQSALDNIDEIIMASDAVMVARGDLAVEVPFEQLSFWQKMIITKCRVAAKPVITATQMLKSMVDNPRPTRAEVSDVANAVYDSTSAVMLSEETAMGKYPVKAVATQAKIVAFNEQYVESNCGDWTDGDKSSSITHAAMYLIDHQQKVIDSIICLTETGKTASLLSRFRPKIPIHVLTSNEQTYRKLALYFGVIPHIIEFPENGLQEPYEIVKEAGLLGIVEPEKNVLVVYGSIWKTPGLTNSLSLMTVPGRRD
ncbi:MAG: pyruvate kinase [Candidatus Pacebacteria bacterium RIFOXYB1_FULL_39_46]|nr:MAG: pyruvate kinase [Candidatus Pacebacteria bacterium RIFOXYA1_FULL_38_18]OGJ38568.1 MAG: pyruvate kinase [Candidatus Pacebacteria bacterium RIFOXYB1_FULL_39_46]OGJ40428.1 MAG: pyruvate kinase [Candidatus Pacebacteria bacterium RIFOXYC1_FULL_39_21]OGJ40547.1 MAG: pyruvate kinase [Candidatus Pacebacteria bacterium RIFOXYD1_FULL_39_27]